MLGKWTVVGEGARVGTGRWTQAACRQAIATMVIGTGKVRCGHVPHRSLSLRPASLSSLLASSSRLRSRARQRPVRYHRCRHWQAHNHKEDRHSPYSAAQADLSTSANLPKDTPSTSEWHNDAEAQRFAKEIASRTSQRVTAPPPQARPNAGASWSNEPEPPIQSERPMPNLVSAGPMRADPSRCFAPHSLAGEASARTTAAGEP
jgi:hypothetical protein